MQTHSCQSHMGIYASTEMHPLFFFSLSVSFLRTHTRRAEEPFLGSSLYHRHTVFAGKHSILFAGNLDDAFCLPFFFFFLILRQFLPFSFSFCFDKGFRSA